MSADLTALRDAVAQANTVGDSAIVLIRDIAAQLTVLAQNGVDPAELQALADQLNTDSAELATAVTENTPSA